MPNKPASVTQWVIAHCGFYIQKFFCWKLTTENPLQVGEAFAHKEKGPVCRVVSLLSADGAAFAEKIHALIYKDGGTDTELEKQFQAFVRQIVEKGEMIVPQRADIPIAV